MTQVQTPPPITPSGEVTPEMIEAACEARNIRPGVSWTDGTTEGHKILERMLAERMITAALACKSAAAKGSIQ